MVLWLVLDPAEESPSFTHEFCSSVLVSVQCTLMGKCTEVKLWLKDSSISRSSY
jgi:hypothetical protein